MGPTPGNAVASISTWDRSPALGVSQARWNRPQNCWAGGVRAEKGKTKIPHRKSPAETKTPKYTS